jgi:acyl carrier protein phosphodiesterase
MSLVSSLRTIPWPGVVVVVSTSIFTAYLLTSPRNPQFLIEVRRGFSEMNKKFDGLEKSFDRLEKSFDRLEKSFDHLEKSFDERFDNIEKRIGKSIVL